MSLQATPSISRAQPAGAAASYSEKDVDICLRQIEKFDGRSKILARDFLVSYEELRLKFNLPDQDAIRLFGTRMKTRRTKE
jgi:hypothetical protein